MRKEIIVTRCNDCPFCDIYDSGISVTCNAKPDSAPINSSMQGTPITPEWCPLNKSEIIVKKV